MCGYKTSPCVAMLCHFVTKFGHLFERVLIGLKDVSNDVYCYVREDGLYVWVCFMLLSNTLKTCCVSTGRRV